MANQIFFIGIDVSKQTLDLTIVKDGNKLAHQVIENNYKSLQKLFKLWAKEFSFTSESVFTCLEHTGIYGYRLLDYLKKNNYKVCLETPYNIKHSQGLQRGKNDKIDSLRIALYAWKNRESLKEWTDVNESIKQIKHLLTLRKGLITSKTKLLQYVNETSQFVDKATGKQLTIFTSKPIKALEREIENIDARLKEIIKNDADLQNMYSILVSVEGIGPYTALLFIATTNGFLYFKEAKKFACYAGVVPFENTSGSSIKGKSKVSKFANMDLKAALHLCALTTIKSKGELGQYYRRKVNEGKNKMCVINAIRNKIVLRVFACIKANKMYEKRIEHIC